MSKLTEQISVCLHKIDTASSREERTINTTTLHNLLPALLTEHEKLEREAEAGRDFMQDMELLYAKKDCECQGVWVKCMHAILGEKVEAYRTACEK